VVAPVSHAEFEQLAAGYALGALEPDDEHAFAAHMDGCPACRQTVRERELVLLEVAHSVPPASPPRALRRGIRRRMGRIRGRRRPVLRRRVPPALARLGAVVLAAAVVFGLAFWNMTLRNQVALEQRRRSEIEAVGRLLNSGQAQVVALAPAAGGPGRGTVIASAAGDEGVLLVEGLPPPAGRVHQLWAIPTATGLDQAIPIRTWTPTRGTAIIRFGGLPLGGDQAFAVTTEPLGGSLRPTLPAVLVSAGLVAEGSRTS
jgi:anti-sigma-K factor RskA